LTPTATGEILTARLAELKLPATLERIVVGNRLTRYECRPMTSTRARAILRTREDLAMALGEPSVKVMAPLSGHPDVFAVEVPSESVLVRLSHLPPAQTPLSFPLGLDGEGEPLFCDLAGAPHVLLGGETGSGKSGMLNAMICSLLLRFSPDDLRFLMIDPKQVELTQFERIAHLLAPVAEIPDEAFNLLTGGVELMELRYSVFAQYGVRSLSELNAKLAAEGRRRYPYIICVIDELADLMMTDRKQCESLIVRIAQKSRAVGIHLVIATQSPRVSVCTGLIKSNCPTRIAFRVSSMTDSRVLRDRNGADQLLGRGDGLYSPGGAEPQRFQAPWVESNEIHRICGQWR
jgi:S-DNA-T family DNA segregation ATPase FtsK/SpoIIIE